MDIYARDSDGKVYDIEVQNDDADPVGKLMHDFRCTSAVDMFYRELAKSVRHFKETEGGQNQVCKAM